MAAENLAIGQVWRRSDGWDVSIQANLNWPHGSDYVWLGSDSLWYSDAGCENCGRYILLHRVHLVTAEDESVNANKELAALPTAASILDAAASHMRDRAATYDSPEGEWSMTKTIEAFNAVTGRDLKESEGWLLLDILKQVRLFARPGYHADSAEDHVAYASLLAEAKAKEGGAS